MPNLPESLPWRSSYATDIPSIDAHQQGLFKVLRLLQEATHDGRVEGELEVILEWLERHARVHFETEETFMRKAGFTGVGQHAQEHSRFTTHLRHLKRRFEMGDPQVPSELILMLYGWMQDHVLHQDRIFAEHLRIQGKVGR